MLVPMYKLTCDCDNFILVKQIEILQPETKNTLLK